MTSENGSTEAAEEKEVAEATSSKIEGDTESETTINEIEVMSENTAEVPTQDEAEQLKNELVFEKDKYIRLLAEFDNFRKRVTKERADLLKYQGEKIVLDLLEVLDNLELALNNPGSDYEKLKSGLEMIQKLFVDALAKWEIKGESSIGAEFNPSQHAAISKVKSADAKSGTIISELKKKYFYKDKLLRAADVVVATDEE